MKIRTKLVVVFLLVAVVPLLAIVLYSYVSSLSAVRSAVEEDAAALATRMDDELESIRADLGERITRVGELRLSDLEEDGDTASMDSDVRRQLLDEIGSAAPFLESLELTPAAPAPPAPPLLPVPGVLAVSEPELVAALPPVVVPQPPDPIPVPGARVTGATSDEKLPPKGLDAETRAIIDEAVAEGRELTPEEKALVGKSALKLALSSIELVKPVVVSVLSSVEPAIDAHQSGAAKQMEKDAARMELEVRKLEIHRALTASQQKSIEEGRKKAHLVLGREIDAPILEQGRVVGHVRAQVSGEEIMSRILSIAGRERGEIPFAIDSSGELHTASAEDREALTPIPFDELRSSKGGRYVFGQWVVATSFDDESGLRLGIARPMRDSIETMRRTAARNFGVGMALILVALFGITPISRHLTRDITLVTEGAERIARGDLDVEVPVRSRDEVGQLATAFNRMAQDLSEQQKQLVEEERLRREQEVRQSLMTADIERKTLELEDAREFQLSLLPKSLPRHAAYEVAVHMKTATEVGGDYYDFRSSVDGSLIVAIGDATGHGARAGTMVTVVKSLFSAWTGDETVASFLGEATRTIKRMELGRMAMALSIARFERDGMVVSSAAMPPPLVWRAATGKVEEIAVQGMPLGTLAYDYDEWRVPLGHGDTVLMMTDGFPELLNRLGEPFGYSNVQSAFRDVADSEPEELLARLAAAADAWNEEPSDDITFVVVRFRGSRSDLA